MILTEIVEKRRVQLAREQQALALSDLKQLALHDRRSCNCLYDALKGEKLSVIAEVKKASPSKGLICEEFDPVAIAMQYEQAGADAISVLTEEHYFQGSLDYLKAVRSAVGLPILRKDFILDPYQIYQAKVAGADAILLIAAILDGETLERFKNIAYGLGLSCLAEVHNRQELETVLECGFRIVGINNRDLKTFDVDLNTTAQLMRYVPGECVVVSESGIAAREDMQAVRRYGAQAVLIGETLMRSGNIAQTLAELRR